MPGYIDQSGATQQVELNVGMYREAADRGMNMVQYINAEYPTNVERDGTAFQQFMADLGIFLRPNADVGIRPSTLDQILNPKASGSADRQAGINVKEAVPASRILFPAVILSAIEDKLIANLTMNPAAFDSMVGFEETVNQERYEQPVINFDKPAAARSQGIAQLAQPASMMTITTSDKAYRIPTFSLGLEVSDQALKATTIDFVALSLARQFAVERNERAQNYILALLNGDVDNNDSSLATLGLVDNSTVFDSLATGGVFTQKAWMKFLMKNGTKRTITHLITDVDTALKIEGRTGKPEVMKDDSKTSRFDTQFKVANPTWATNPTLFLTDIASWPANTVMALDKNWAIRRVRNLSADYNAIESYVLRRSTAIRFDFGEHVNRLYNEAFAGLVMV